MSRSLAIEDLYEMVFLSRPRISPDGKNIAYVATVIDKRTHSYRSAVWVTPAAGGAVARQLTGEPANATDPSWSPDGNYLAFLSEREGASSRAEKSDQHRRPRRAPGTSDR